MKSVEALVGKRVALVDRGFVVIEGRIVYPTAEGVLEAVDSKSGTLTLRMGSDDIATTFFRDAIRCVREAAEVKPAAPAEG